MSIVLEIVVLVSFTDQLLIKNRLRAVTSPKPKVKSNQPFPDPACCAIKFTIIMVFVFTGKNPKEAETKKADDKGKEQADPCRGETCSTPRVRFKTADDAMDGVIEDPGMIADKDSETNTGVAARVPSFYIGKPLVDFDAGSGRVCNTFPRLFAAGKVEIVILN